MPAQTLSPFNTAADNSPAPRASHLTSSSPSPKAESHAIHTAHTAPASSTEKAAPTLFETENDLSRNRRIELNALLNQRLADSIDLQMQLKQAHWNVKGPSFIGLHELFDSIARSVDTYTDQIAERIAQLGGVAQGTVRVSASRSRLPEYPLDIAQGSSHVEAVARALSLFARETRRTIEESQGMDDPLTADLFTDISRGIEKSVWFVEAHSQAPK